MQIGELNMKILIVYSSMTGNTKKLAAAIDARLDGDKTLCPVGEAPDPRGFDVIALGFWLMAGKPDPASLDYLKRIENQKLFLFATHGAAAGSDHAEKAMALAKSAAGSAQILGTFSCQGEVSPAFLEKARAKTPPPVWIEDAPGAAGHPDDVDLQHLIKVLDTRLTESNTL
jgi:flavodoxin